MMLLGFWLVLLVPSVDPLSCFQCEKCGHWVGDPQPCRPVMNRCMKLVVGDRVDRVCATQDACGYGLIQRWGKPLWHRLRQATSDDDDRDKVEEIYCCDTDYCNASETISGGSKTNVILAVMLIFFWQRWT